MVTKTATRPSPRSSQSHSHTNSVSNAHRSSNTPAARVTAHSVGQAAPPSLLRSPGSHVDARTPSPNYFGLIVDPASNPRDTVGPKDNWSPPTSSIQSFGGTTPKHVVEGNPEFELFRRRTEEGNTFNLGHGNLSHFASTPGSARSRHDRQSDHQDAQPSPKTRPAARESDYEAMDLDGSKSPTSKAPPSANYAGDRGAPSFFDIPRQESPASLPSPNPPTQRSQLSTIDDRHPRLSLPQNKADPPQPRLQQRTSQHQRADTLPSNLEEGPALIPPPKLRDMLQRLQPSQLLLLDLRVFPQYSASRIKGALNLCIPTTLLKRPSFNLQKLQDTFTNESEKKRFSRWRSAQFIVVYDASSSEKKDAVSAVNTLKKFTTEGWKGTSYILKSGFQGFSKMFPDFVEKGSTQAAQSSKISLSLGAAPDVAPVVGGCEMPSTENAANPFFSNIRQNMDLIGGVGQFDVKLPEGFDKGILKSLPNWLSKAVDREDHGKWVADKFLHLELAEKSRLTKAYSKVSYGTPNANSKDVQIAGFEQGGKNRYKDIWPYEHARVKIQGRSDGVCDYVNASHIKATRSNKRYIASQGPLPATFEDFWSVIWDQDIRVIVMLTAEQEGGQLKCHSYWSSSEYGALKLKSLSEKKVSLDPRRHRHHSPSDRHDSGRRRANTTTDSAPRPQRTSSDDTPHAVIRKFTLSHSAHPFSPMREITQVHYSSWPDLGTPASADQLLSLVELTNREQRAASSPTKSRRSDDPEDDECSRPILVHCSAGCGRTGTFCTIDSVIDMLKRQHKEIKSGVTPMEIAASSQESGDYLGKGKGHSVSIEGDWIFDQDLDLVEKTVEDFRGQRLSMVQNLRQYVLCYEAVLEWIARQTSGETPRTGRDRSGSDSGVERRNARGSTTT